MEESTGERGLEKVFCEGPECDELSDRRSMVLLSSIRRHRGVI